MVPNLSTGACASTDDRRFLANSHTRESEQAKEMCLSCPVFVACLDYALHVGVHGVWGGTDLAERKLMRARRGIVAEPVLPDGLWNDIVTSGPARIDDASFVRGVCEATGEPANGHWHRRVGSPPTCEPCLEWLRFQQRTERRAAWA